MTKVWGIGSERTGNTRARGKGERRRQRRPPDGAPAAAGPIALILAPAIAAAWLGLLAWKGREPRADGMLLATHAGSFGAALSFFHQWAQYRAGWGPFVRNFEALRTLWF